MNITHPPAHHHTPFICHPEPPPPAQQYHCKNHQKCHTQDDPEPAPHCNQPPPQVVETTFITLYHPVPVPAGPGEPVNHPPPTPPNQAIDIVQPLIVNLPLHFITATHQFVGAPENVSVPPVIVIDE